MKKMILIILLSAIMLLCGCGADAGSVVTDTETQAANTPETSVIETPEVANVGMALFESVMERVQKNIDTGTFEGFTEESTFKDIAAADKELYYAADIFAIDFLGFPANIFYDYNRDQDSLGFYIFTDERTDYEEKISNMIGKLDDTLGSHTEENGDSYNHEWQTDTYTVYVKTTAASFEEHGTLAGVLFEHMDKAIAPAEIPGIFCNLFGVEYTPEYENKMQALLNNKNRINYLAYLDDDISIRFMFTRVGEINNVFNVGEYEFIIDISRADSALDFMEACMYSLKQLFGEPNDCDYISFDNDFAKTAEEMKQLGWDKFRLRAFWETGITLNIIYNGETTGFTIGFDRRSF